MGFKYGGMSETLYKWILSFSLVFANRFTTIHSAGTRKLQLVIQKMTEYNSIWAIICLDIFYNRVIYQSNGYGELYFKSQLKHMNWHIASTSTISSAYLLLYILLNIIQCSFCMGYKINLLDSNTKQKTASRLKKSIYSFLYYYLQHVYQTYPSVQISVIAVSILSNDIMQSDIYFNFPEISYPCYYVNKLTNCHYFYRLILCKEQFCVGFRKLVSCIKFPSA